MLRILTNVQVKFLTEDTRNVDVEWCIGSIHDSDPRDLVSTLNQTYMALLGLYEKAYLMINKLDVL
jgi:hypothetical protein